jgi:hypothetical protein
LGSVAVCAVIRLVADVVARRPALRTNIGVGQEKLSRLDAMGQLARMSTPRAPWGGSGGCRSPLP